MDFTDIKLALIRFISEFLIQTAHFENNFLDELVNMDV
jgi:allantoicase